MTKFALQTWVEKAYDHYGKPYNKITGIHDFAKTTNGNTQIIKYHGDLTMINTILTGYFERLELNTPLDNN